MTVHDPLTGGPEVPLNSCLVPVCPPRENALYRTAPVPLIGMADARYRARRFLLVQHRIACIGDVQPVCGDTPAAIIGDVL